MKVNRVFFLVLSLLTFAMSSAQQVGTPEGLLACSGDSILLVALHDAEDIEWNTGASNDSIWATEFGTYYFTELLSDSPSDSVFIEFTPLPDPLTNEEHATCFGLNDGGIEIFSIAGIPIESVVWNGKLVGSSIFNLYAGEYEYLITDINGCTAAGSVEIDEPSALEIVNFELVTAELNVQVEGGTPPYSYFWNGEEVMNPAPFNGEELSVEVVDLEGCEAQSTYSHVSDFMDLEFRPYFIKNAIFFPCFRDGHPMQVELYGIDGRTITVEVINKNSLELDFDVPDFIIVRFQIDKQFYSWRIAKVK